MPSPRRLRLTLGALAAAIAVTAGVVTAIPATSDPASAATARIVPSPAGVKYEPVKIRKQQLRLPSKPYPLAHTVPIKGVPQARSTWCLPAASEVSLGTLGVRVRQSTLARKMGTNSHGTSQYQGIEVLDTYANKKLLNYSRGWDVSTGAEMMAGAVTDVGVLDKAPVLIVWAEKLPWSYRSRSNPAHAIVIYGYDLTKKTITVWDPSPYANGGKHVISADKLSAASLRGDLYLITPGLNVDNLSNL